jgi:hypothetical protein
MANLTTLYFLPRSIDIAALPSAPLAERARLPRCSALYFVVDWRIRDEFILYIGQTCSLRARWYNHHIMARLPFWSRPHIAWLQAKWHDLPAMECEAIALFHPPLNTVIPRLVWEIFLPDHT